ncbi:general secretion pathway protein GspK [Candidatus Omnitrophota bacterium]
MNKKLETKLVIRNSGKEKGTILIVSLWVILIFSMVAVSLGVRGSLEAKIARFFYERTQNRALARSGIFLGKFVLESDKDTRLDGPQDTWYNQESFKAALNVTTFDSLDLSIVDEESKININAASEKILSALFKHISNRGMNFENEKEDYVADILFFRGDSAFSGETSLGKEYTGRPFRNIEDLLLLENCSQNDFNIIRDYITVFPYNGDQLIVNINTAQAEIINILLLSAVSDNSTRETLFTAIENHRTNPTNMRNYACFTKRHLSAYKLLEELGLAREVKLVSLAVQFLRNITVDSQYFTILSRIIDTEYTVSAIVGPSEEKFSKTQDMDSELSILSWRETG